MQQPPHQLNVLQILVLRIFRYGYMHTRPTPSHLTLIFPFPPAFRPFTFVREGSGFGLLLELRSGGTNLLRLGSRDPEASNDGANGVALGGDCVAL
ncbi:hypothetical protein MD484_g4714, partial [Candolleomyces efflorescens]